MTISYLASGEGNNDNSGATITVPAGVESGDRLIVVVESNSITGYTHLGADTWSTLYNSVGVQGGAGGSQITSVYTKVANSSDAEKAYTFEITPTGSGKVSAVVAYRGTVTTPQVLASAILPASSSSANMAIPVVDVAALPTTLVAAATRKGGSVPITTTAPTGFTQRVTDTINGNVVSIADADAGATGATSVAAYATSATSQAGAGVLIALAEGEAPVQTQPIFRRFTIDGWYPAIES